MPGLLVFSEKDDLAIGLLPTGAELAGKINAGMSAAVLGPDAKSRADRFIGHGLKTAYVAEHSLLAKVQAAVYARALFQIAELSGADTVLLVATKLGGEIAPRLAQMLGADCFTNILNIEIKDNKLVTSRYGLGGITIKSEYAESPRKVIAMLPQTPETTLGKSTDFKVVEVNLDLKPADVTIIETVKRERESVDIEKAETLVCIGRGLKKKEDLSLIQELAGKLKAEIGCTKELASNLGWLSEDRIVGMSGKRCKPKVAFSIGVSGQTQHVAGLVGARIIVAINNNADAPIFRASDYGIVGDLYQVVPKLIERLK